MPLLSKASERHLPYLNDGMPNTRSLPKATPALKHLSDHFASLKHPLSGVYRLPLSSRTRSFSLILPGSFYVDWMALFAFALAWLFGSESIAEWATLKCFAVSCVSYYLARVVLIPSLCEAIPNGFTYNRANGSMGSPIDFSNRADVYWRNPIFCLV